MSRNGERAQPGREDRIDFVIGGVQRGGTSALDQYLRRHPALCMADCKEPHFFDNEAVFARSQVNLTDYHAHFDWTNPEKIRGEATPSHMYWWPAARRIWHYNCSMKWILILRNPIERAYSQWNMEIQRNLDQLPFLAAIEQERARVRTRRPLQHRIYSYIDRGHYCEQIRRVWHLFSEEQTLILRSEELRQRPQVAIDRVCAFLGVASMQVDAHVTAHARPYGRPMTDQERRRVQSILEPEIRSLEAMLGWDCSEWLCEPARSVIAG